MKVLLFSTQWPEYMIELANAMTKHCSTILMLPNNHRFTPKHKELIAESVLFEPFKVVFYKSIKDNFVMLSYILKILWKYKPDILHIQSNGHRLFPFVFFLMPPKTKVINTIHDPVKHLGDKVSHKIDDSWAVYWGKKFTSRYIVHGEYLKKLLINAYGVDQDVVDVVKHGNFRLYKSFQREKFVEEKNTVLFFGRIWEYKGLEYFIKAANIVNRLRGDVKFIIAGAGDDFEPYQKIIERVERFEIYNRRIAIEEVGMFFERASIIVLPYIEATQSGVIPVAFAYSKPVIATNVGAIPEVVDDGINGFIVEPQDAISIASRILYLLDNKNKKELMGKAAYRKAVEDLSWERVAVKTLDSYQSCL